MGYGIKLKVWGERACFTRPEMKVERVSYDVMTPSAARGILEAIYWKPSIRWVIDKIHVLKPVKFENIRRNEVASKIPANKITAAMKDPTKELELFIEVDRQQRAAMILKDVAYIIEAHFEPTEKDGENEGKHLDIFKRRARSGQCFNQPYFGCREFAVFFDLAEGELPSAVQEDRDLGWMLYDMDFPLKNKKTSDIYPMFFRAVMKAGCIDIPHPNSEEVRR